MPDRAPNTKHYAGREDRTASQVAAGPSADYLAATGLARSLELYGGAPGVVDLTVAAIDAPA